MNENVKEFLKKVPGLRPAVKFAKNRVIDAKAFSSLLAERRIRHGDSPIKVGFVCQYIPAWTKVENLYLAMLNDPRFEPYLLCVPSSIKNNALINPECLENDTLDYFLSHGYDVAINTLIGKNTWLDLKSLNLSYIIYNRPYNAFMPPCYTSKEVSKYSKICLIMYGIEISEDTTNIALNRDFMSTVYIYFSDFKSMVEKNTKNNMLLHKLRLQKTICSGYPMIEKLFHYQNASSISWSFSQNAFRVLWTPRWTTDPYVGGTNFFEYCNTFMEMASKHPEIDFLFRPHPLMFSHFVEIGKMSEADVITFKNRCSKVPNVRIDQQQEYEATFWGSSVLVSDISSIIPEYLVTGKPLIFCNTNMKLNLVPHMKRILDGCYVVQNEFELVQCLLMLKDGNDPLKQKRQDIINELFGEMNDGVSSRILAELTVDYFYKK